MTTLSDVANSVLAAADTNAGLDLAARWVIERYQQLAARTRLRHLRRTAELLVPSVLRGGSVAVTRNASTVMYDADAVDVLSNLNLKGRFLRSNVGWYEIASSDVSGLVLKSPYAEDTNTAATYEIVARTHALPADAGYIGAFYNPELQREIVPVTAARMDLAHKYSMSTVGPMYVADKGHRDGVRHVELFPYRDHDMVVSYVYWAVPRFETIEQQMPAAFNTQVLKEGALIDLYRYKSAVSANKGRADLAGFWRNESRTQEAKWEGHILEAIRSDRGAEDEEIGLRSRYDEGQFGSDLDDVSWSKLQLLSR